jgi:hypothetical protein
MTGHTMEKARAALAAVFSGVVLVCSASGMLLC